MLKISKKKRKTIISAILMISIILLTFTNTDILKVFAESDRLKNSSLAYISQVPILIDSDSDFITYGFPGSGTINDPYRIENYQITTTEEIGIQIESTSKYFIIQNCTISASKTGILIDRVSSGCCTIRNNTCNYHDDYGIKVFNSHATKIIENDCSFNRIDNHIPFFSGCGIKVDYSNNVIIANNTCISNEVFSIDIYHSDYCTIFNNTCENSYTSIDIDISSYVTVANNCCSDNRWTGVSLLAGSHNSIYSNFIKYNSYYGLYIYHGDNHNFYDNYLILNNQGDYKHILISQAYDDSEDLNTWYNSNTNIGNYWSDLNGRSNYPIDGDSYANDPYPIFFPDSDNDTLDDLLEEIEYFTNPFDNDTDDDLMPDGWEAFHSLNPLQNDADADEDLDGLNNYEEYLYNTHPFNDDSDSDGLLDGEEVHTYGTNPSLEDSENDQMPDGWEIQYGLNPLVNDSFDDFDTDGLLNIAEFFLNTYPNLNDTDSDLVLDGDEVHIYGSNPLHDDSDYDGLLDGEEVYIYDTDPIDNDSDDDGLLDGDEIHFYNTNPNSSDSDDDGMDDKWEVDNILDPTIDDAELDSDSDGLSNIEEYNKGTYPQDNDSDNDDLLDGEEVNTYFTDPLNPDSDSDGFLDGEEVAAGKDPLDPESFPMSKDTVFIIAIASASGVLLSLIGVLVYFIKKKGLLAKI